MKPIQSAIILTSLCQMIEAIWKRRVRNIIFKVKADELISNEKYIEYAQNCFFCFNNISRKDDRWYACADNIWTSVYGELAETFFFFSRHHTLLCNLQLNYWTKLKWQYNFVFFIIKSHLLVHCQLLGDIHMNWYWVIYGYSCEIPESGNMNQCSLLIYSFNWPQ